MPSDPSPCVTRGFIEVDGREVHYRATGRGPAALFIHSSPTNSSYVLPDMLALADSYRCVAFDTPGFGLSDPLPGEALTVADLADATAAAMRAFGLPALPVFGTHSGAAIALELGFRHPALVTGLMLDGVPIFTSEEVAPLRDGDYFAPLVVDRLGGHFASTWTRFRDQSIWFPWCDPQPANINENDLATPEATHRWTHMFYAAAAHYKPAYLAVNVYGEGAVAAAAELRCPAVYMALEADMLFDHLERLPALNAGQQIVAIGNAPARRQAATREGFARFGTSASAEAPFGQIDSNRRVRRHFVMDGARPQFVRTLGDSSDPVLLLLHDVPGAGLLLFAEMGALAETQFVVVPDLPGSGESDALAEGASLSAHAAALWWLCDRLGLDRVRVRGFGFSASLAVEMALQQPERCAGVEIDGLYTPTQAERATMRACYAPSIAVEADGAHWYRLWLRLRDSLVYWPWYDHRRAALRRIVEDFDGQRLHDWTVEVMKQAATHHRLIHAILEHDAAAAVARLPVPPTRLSAASPVGHAYPAERHAAP